MARVIASAPAVAAAVTLGAAIADAKVLVTRHNAGGAPAVAAGRVFWEEERRPYVSILEARPGSTPRVIFRLRGPRGRASYAEAYPIRASRRLVAFTVIAGYGDDLDAAHYECPAFRELPAGDPRCRYRRETFHALFAGPPGGPYRRLSAALGVRRRGCHAGQDPGWVDVSGTTVAYSEEVAHCVAGRRRYRARLVVGERLGRGPTHVVEDCQAGSGFDASINRVALAGRFVAMAENFGTSCAPRLRLRLFDWRTHKRAYDLPRQWTPQPFAVTTSGELIALVDQRHTPCSDRCLAKFGPSHSARPRLIGRFGESIDDVKAAGRVIAVTYSPQSPPTGGAGEPDRVVMSDRTGRNFRLVAHAGIWYPQLGFDGSLLAWQQGPFGNRIYAVRASL